MTKVITKGHSNQLRLIDIEIKVSLNFAPFNICMQKSGFF